MRELLLIFQGDTNIIPEMNFALFHVNQVAQLSEKSVNTGTIEAADVA